MIPDEEIQELMESHDLDEDTAEQVQEAMDEYGVDEDDAVELVEEGL
jgi:division protein CdvB (Snf7/Vps24/ESCRT-III family)